MKKTALFLRIMCFLRNQNIIFQYVSYFSWLFFLIKIFLCSCAFFSFLPLFSRSSPFSSILTIYISDLSCLPLPEMNLDFFPFFLSIFLSGDLVSLSTSTFYFFYDPVGTLTSSKISTTESSPSSFYFFAFLFRDYT